jgi:hypothetical protein
VNDLELETALEASVRDEREATALVLKYLREVERRKLFLGRGYSSLFTYCTGRLGYSEPEAMLRIQAMRLVRTVPEAAKKIEEGKLTLSVAAKIQSAVRQEPARAKELVKELTGASKREAEKKLAALFPEAPKPEKARPVSEDKVEIRFTVTREEFELFQKLLDRKAHSNFERKYETLFTALAKAELKKLEGKQREDALLHGLDEVKSRYVRASIKRSVWKRDESRCQFVSKDGHHCNETHGLQLDHIRPFALGGATSPENLRLFCGPHNRARNSS